jgi:hypothetical protein
MAASDRSLAVISATCSLVSSSSAAATCAADWGLYTTVTENLGACAGLLGDLVGAGPDRERIRGRIGTVGAAMAAAPKTMGWQLRAKVGRRVRWYQRPEEVTR